MFVNDTLKEHLLRSATIKGQSTIIAEWNMNYADNIVRVGNYRYRPLEGVAAKYGTVPSFYDSLDEGNFYTGATDSDIVIDGGIDETSTPMLLRQPKEKEKLLYSLEDCLGRFRPRSGINKVRYGITPYIHHSNPDMALRPRYYMAHKNDPFKYWTSYRLENGTEYGIANASPLGQNHINDAAPFVVYNTPVAANRIVLKMQTNVGTVDQSPQFNLAGEIADPLYGNSNKTTPAEWHIDVLIGSNWETIKSFNGTSLRANGQPIIAEDGYVEVGYGLVVPEKYENIFVYAGELASVDALPTSASSGDAYLIKTSNNDIGTYYIWTTGGYEVFTPEYGWKLIEEDISINTPLISDLGNPEAYSDPISSSIRYREFQYIRGIRIVVKRMNKFNSVFDLIEMSPRIVANISDITESFSISKIASDLGTAGLPVGQLLASVGSLSLFDVSQAFSENNFNSIVPMTAFKNMKVRFYESIFDGNEYYFIPVKTMYADQFPVINSTTRMVSIELRDFYAYLESVSAPQLLLTNVSSSYAIATVLDYIGFTNYEFKRVAGEKEEIIPFFFVDSNQSVAQVLQNIAVSTQSAMFFDEYNNLVVMSKNYMMPSEEERSTDLTLLGTDDFISYGPVENNNLELQVANIIDISTQEDSIFNDGKILFTTRYIQKSQASTKQAYMLDSQKTWIYKPVLLWEAVGEENIKSQNEQQATQNAFALTAIPLKSNLTSDLPRVSNGRLINNIVDFGEAVYWLGRYNGYFYANGEIIKFDAIEYSVPGIIDAVWITNTQDYQNYFSKITFKGKMYPTGRVRIYSEPNYKVVDGTTLLQEGDVAKHGRGQFGTEVVAHFAGVDPGWTDGSRIRGIGVNSKFLFDTITNNEPDVVEALGEVPANLRNGILTAKAELKTLYENINFLNQELLQNPGDATTIAAISSIQADVDALNATIASDMKDLYDILIDSSNYLNSDDANSQAQRAQVTGKIKNFLSYAYESELQENGQLATDTQMVQASALVMDGAGSANPIYSPINHITYAYSSIQSESGEVTTTNKQFTHFGTRMRILGKVGPTDSEQQAFGSMTYLTVETDNPEDRPNISGGSGGVAGLLNPETGEGYYFEIAALDASNVEQFKAGNVFFYKIVASNTSSNDFGYEKTALPQLLWRGVSSIVVDSGDFVGQSRVFAQETQTVYDLAFEYVDNVDGTRTFYLYLNGAQIGTVTDTTPVVAGNATALFIRGTSKCMFENIYALASNYSQNPALKLSPVINSAFGTDVVNINDSFSKYAISGLVQSTYLSGLSPSETPKYNIYYDEFGTIMREAAYLNVRYDKAYPALYSRIVPNITKLKSYNISSYYGGAYGAEFLVFNATDTVIAMDSSTGTPLQIQGIAFTQNSENELTVDEYFNKNSDLSSPQVESGLVVGSPLSFKQRYQEIKNTRVTYGKNEFVIEAPYIQSRDTANSLMKWLSTKIMKPRKSIGVDIFAMPILQLGDIVQVDYSSEDIYQVSPSDRFVVYQIDYSKTVDGPVMKIFLSEVS